MKIKMTAIRYPFHTIYCNSLTEYVRPFGFEPKVFKHLTESQAVKFGEFLSENIEGLKEIKEAYLSLKEKFNVRFIEFHREFEISEDVLKKIIDYAKANNLSLMPYVEILPYVDEKQFDEIKRYAKKHGYKEAISKFLSPK